jgi:hypothetical protein
MKREMKSFTKSTMNRPQSRISCFKGNNWFPTNKPLEQKKNYFCSELQELSPQTSNIFYQKTSPMHDSRQKATRSFLRKLSASANCCLVVVP